MCRGAMRGAQFLGREITTEAPNHCRVHRKVPALPQVDYFLQCSTFASKDLRFENVGAKLVSCPGRHLTLLRPCFRVVRKNAVLSPNFVTKKL